MLYTLMVILYVIVCLFLIAVVLLQTGKRADLAGAFGGGGSQTAFGTRGAATFLSRMTTVFAVLFMVLSLALSIYSSGGSRRSGSVTPQTARALFALPEVDGGLVGGASLDAERFAAIVSAAG